MAKTYLESLLGENEHILLVTHQHWFVLFSRIFVELFLIVVLLVGISAAYTVYPQAFYGFILLLAPLAGMLYDILIWRNKAYVITSRRVLHISGVLSKNVVDSSLEKVTDVRLSQSFLGRLFDFGDVEILTASEVGNNLFRRIANPVKFKTSMLNAKENMGFDEGPARQQVQVEEDIPTLIAKLDGLRKQGIITEAEFQKKKADLLAKL
jgi:uncharacterized membrane protein YdbT with pleckstrin-like domain